MNGRPNTLIGAAAADVGHRRLHVLIRGCRRRHEKRRCRHDPPGLAVAALLPLEPQPYLVPVRPICSRGTQSSGVSGSTSTSICLPLTLSFAMGRASSWGGVVLIVMQRRRYVRAATRQTISLLAE